MTIYGKYVEVTDNRVSQENSVSEKWLDDMKKKVEIEDLHMLISHIQRMIDIAEKD